MMKKYDFSSVLSTGSDGSIGSYIDFGIKTDRQTLDVTNGEEVLNFVKAKKPKAIIHLAGATDMNKCESEPGFAYELNVRGTYNVACAARAVGATMVYASTSRVFKGDKDKPYAEDDVPESDTHYGRTKHIGELIVTALVPRHIIARTCWVFGGGPKRDNKFYGKILGQLNSGQKELVALDDVFGSPTYGKDYIATIKDLLKKGKQGIFHITNQGVATRADIAREIIKLTKSDASVRPVDRSFFASGSTLPVNESVASKHCVLRPWQEALAEYLKNEWPTQ